MQTTMGILTSVPNRLINKKFMVKVSTMTSDDKIQSVLMVVIDVIENQFCIRHFVDEISAVEFINSLKGTP